MLGKLDGRNVGADVLFETLKLEALDWGLDHGVETEMLDAEQKPVIAGDDR